jgi:hypothetical protein
MDIAVRLYCWLLNSPAYLSLSCPARAILVEVTRTDGAQAGRVRAGFPVTLGLISAFLCRRLQPVCQPLPS